MTANMPPPSRQDSQTSTMTAHRPQQPPTATAMAQQPQQQGQAQEQQQNPDGVEAVAAVAAAAAAATSTPPSIIRVPTSDDDDIEDNGDDNDNNNNINDISVDTTSASFTSLSLETGRSESQSQSQSQLSWTNDEEIRDGCATAASAATAQGGVGEDTTSVKSTGRSSVRTTSSTTTSYTANSASRQQLRQTIEQHGSTNVLTTPERLFLERLYMEGNDVEVELALEVLQDTDLFFEYSTPRHVKEQRPGLREQGVVDGGISNSSSNGNFEFLIGGTRSTNIAGTAAATAAAAGSGDNDDNDDDDATRDGVAASVRSNSAVSVMSSWSTIVPPPPQPPDNIFRGGGGQEETNDDNDDEKKSECDHQQQQKQQPSLPRPGLVERVGSERRLEVLELRRSSGLSTMLWKAHETGLAVTATASRASLKRRESLDSLSSRMSGMRLMSAAASEMIFRTRGEGSVTSALSASSSISPPKQRISDSTGSGTVASGAAVDAAVDATINASSSSSTSIPLSRGTVPRRSSLSSSSQFNKNSFNIPPRPRRPYARSQSMTGAILRPSHVRGGSFGSSSSSKVMTREGSVPRIPEPAALNRRASTSSRKSVTFHGIDEHAVDATGLPPSTSTQAGELSSTPTRRSKTLRRSVSDSIQYDPSSLQKMTQDDHQRPPRETEEEEKKEAPGTSSSSSTSVPAAAFERSDSIPSLHHGTPIRQDSISSIPSLHHGHPIRQDSISSISSLHHGHPIRQDSISSIPSLHHGHPIRQDSISSIPSLHHGNPIRQASISSIPSLHHGRPIRSDSIATSNSIPSIHHGHPLMDDSTTSFGSGMIRRGVPLRSDASIGSIPSLHHGHPLQANQYWDEMSEDRRPSMNKEKLMKQYATSDDIASAWLQQATSNRHQGHHDNNDDTHQVVDNALPARPIDRRTSLPHDVTIPISDEVSVQNDPFAGEDLTNDFTGTTAATVKTTEDDAPSTPKPVLMRLASRNAYDGEGIEVTELDHAILDDGGEFKNDSTMDTPIRSNQQLIRDVSIYSVNASIRTVNSYDDDVMSILSGRKTAGIFRNIRRTMSDEDMSNMFIGSSRDLFLKLPDPGVSSSDMGGILGLPPNPVPFNVMGEDTSVTSASWDMNSEMSASGRFDAWNVIQDDYINGYGGGGTLGFSILGTSADDEPAQPHVLSPPLMESLQGFLPITKSGQNFFLKYSMVRDGASLPALLKRARGVQYSILAIETIDGEVFGSFTGQAWRKNWNYFGTGESFLWRMRRSRLEKTHGILEQAAMESEIDVFPYTGENRFIQLCTHDRIAVGGGLPTDTEGVDGEKKMEDDIAATAIATSSSSSLLSTTKDHEWGFGLAIQSDLLEGSSSPCMTFGSPSLSAAHSDGSKFEIINVELWTLTPCATAEDAEKLELGKLFLHQESFSNPYPPMHPYYK